MVSFLYMPETGSGDDIRINILCNIVHAKCVRDKHFTSDGFDWSAISFGNDWLHLLQRQVDILNNILIDVLGTVDMLQKFSICVSYKPTRLSNQMKWSTFYAPLCIFDSCRCGTLFQTTLLSVRRSALGIFHESIMTPRRVDACGLYEGRVTWWFLWRAKRSIDTLSRVDTMHSCDERRNTIAVVYTALCVCPTAIAYCCCEKADRTRQWYWWYGNVVWFAEN